MNSAFLLRLVLNGVAAGLLLFAFSYFWQGNAAHEWAGMGLFGLLIVHNLFHRRWFATLSTVQAARRGLFNVGLTMVLLTGMLALLTTSLVISESLFADWRLADDFTARQIHAGIAYWLLIIVSIHLGLRWPMLMAVARKLLGIPAASRVRTWAFRVAIAAIAIQGVGSAKALGLRSRLFFQTSLDWWNFEESVPGFFGHCLAVAGLCMAVTYYTMQWTTNRAERKG